MKASRAGMTLFELLVVMTIIGIVYSIGIFTFRKEKVIHTKMSLSTLKTSLLSISNTSNLRMICETHGNKCHIYSNDGKMITTISLHSNGSIIRYGYDRYGELKSWGDVVSHTNKGLTQACFEMILGTDGSISPLILKSNNTYYAYTPLGGDKPYITKNEEALKNFIFNDSLYPLAQSSTYGIY